MPRTIFLLLAGVFLMGQGVPAPVPRDIPGPAPASGVTPPERLERQPISRGGVVVPPNDGTRAPPGPQMR
jgi:hypothetical protein